MNKKNRIIMFIYATIMSLFLGLYFFMAVMGIDGYNEDVFHKGYTIFQIVGFILFTALLFCLDINEKGIHRWMQIILESVTLSLIVVPIYFVIIMAGHMRGINVLLIVFIQSIWGIVILTLKSVLDKIIHDKNYCDVIMSIFIFLVMVGTLFFAWTYFYYNQLVITNVFDRDLPMLLFINPLLTLLGVLEIQLKGNTQMGMTPVIFYGVFWLAVICVFNIIRIKVRKTVGDKK